MPKNEAENLAHFTLDEMIEDAVNRKSKGIEWKSLFQSQWAA